MRIGIDARLINETGVGRYIRNLLEELGRQDSENNFAVFLRKNAYDSMSLPNSKWEKHLADVPWHSFREQIVMPYLFLKENLDLIHIPYFNMPILYPRKYVATIHDITILHFDTGRATTLPYVFYKIRRAGYRLVLALGLLRATKIFAVSEFVKSELVSYFSIPENKILLTYEGIDRRVVSEGNKPITGGDYFLYVGNAYPHKNIELLIESFIKFLEKIQSKSTIGKVPKLVLVGYEDFFYSRLKQEYSKNAQRTNIIFFGAATDSQLQSLYKYARGFICPSLMEGFGLPPLEALVNDTPVIVSDIPVFHEILKDLPLYFDPHNMDDLVDKIAFVWNNWRELKNKIAAKKHTLERFTWSATASATLQGYISSVT